MHKLKPKLSMLCSAHGFGPKQNPQKRKIRVPHLRLIWYAREQYEFI
jgi:hypothetical protein